MTDTLSYGEWDFWLRQGIRWDRAFTCQVDDSTLFDISGFTPRMRAYRNSQLALTTEGDTPQILTDYQPDGDVATFNLTIMGDVTAQLWLPLGSDGDLLYWIDLIDALVPESNIPIVKGRLLVEREGSQP